LILAGLTLGGPTLAELILTGLFTKT
jgi:hypothetical protein